jgi:hypothetical protein
MTPHSFYLAADFMGKNFARFQTMLIKKELPRIKKELQLTPDLIKNFHSVSNYRANPVFKTFSGNASSLNLYCPITKK